MPVVHLNIGSPPRFQVLVWPAWKGIGWRSWTGGIGRILRGSLVLGWVEVRLWRRP